MTCPKCDEHGCSCSTTCNCGPGCNCACATGKAGGGCEACSPSCSCEDNCKCADILEALLAKLRAFQSGFPTAEIWAAPPSQNTTAVTAVRDLLSESTLQEVTQLCGRCYYHTLQTCLRRAAPMGSVYTATGDIDEMWIRDSAVQVAIYLPAARSDVGLRGILQGVIQRQAFYIMQDPYANSFMPRHMAAKEWTNKQLRGLGRAGWVGTRNFEVDSGAYYLSLLFNFYSAVGHTRAADTLMRPEVYDAALLMLRTWGRERRHEESSPYYYAELPRGGRGSETNYTGMVWSGFRPSDDAQVYGYNTAVNMYVVGAVVRALKLNDVYWKQPRFAKLGRDLCRTIRAGIEEHAVVATQDGTLVYAYEVDGRGNALTDYEDPNVPSLLAIPLLGYPSYNRTIYANTRARILSPDNKFFFESDGLYGLGSTHTPHGFVWPLAYMIEGLTTSNSTRVAELFTWLLRMQCRNGLMHESVLLGSDDLSACTRAWFEWSNALLVTFASQALGIDCKTAAHKERLRDLRAREKVDGRLYGSILSTVKHQFADKSSGEAWEKVIPLA